MRRDRNRNSLEATGDRETVVCGDMETLSCLLTVNIDIENMIIDYNGLSLYQGVLWIITGGNTNIKVTGWDYAEDHIWPDTDTLYIRGV